MKRTFSINTLFKDAWKDYKANWTLFILIGIIFVLIGLVSKLGSSFNPYTHTFEQPLVTTVIGFLLQMFVGLGFIRFLLNMVDGKEYKVEDLFRGAESVAHFIYFVVVALLYGAFIAFGMVLLVVPGLVALVGFIFAQYLMAERKADIFESFQKSWMMTSGNRWKILWLMIVLALFNLLGVIALFVGLIITVPMSYIIYARLYRTLDGELATTPDEKNDIEVVEVLEGNQTA
ncbi:hypothetical protein KC901_01585 [Patescibacteria group bacterium]|nr:hypothetical protein [Patescibacteria group bacterium]